MKIYPHPDRRVRDPRTRAIVPAEGREVPDNDFYWLSALQMGDVSLEAPKAETESSSASE